MQIVLEVDVERAMGIEDIAMAPVIYSNHGGTGADGRRVRLLCEKHCHTRLRGRLTNTTANTWPFNVVRARKTHT